MENKLIEVRNTCTCIVVLATKLTSEEARERAMLRRCGYGLNDPMILITDISSLSTAYSQYDWNNRSMFTAHQYIKDNWDKIETGDTVDVPMIRGESDTPLGTDIHPEEYYE